MSSQRLNQCWNIVNWALRNKLPWNFNWNSYIFILKMSSWKWRPFCPNFNVLTWCMNYYMNISWIEETWNVVNLVMISLIKYYVSKQNLINIACIIYEILLYPWFFGSSWWRRHMETFSALLAICAGNSPVPGEFPAQRPVTRSFDVYFDLRPNKGLSKQSRGWWFETLSCSLWRHRNSSPTDRKWANDKSRAWISNYIFIKL